MVSPGPEHRPVQLIQGRLAGCYRGRYSLENPAGYGHVSTMFIQLDLCNKLILVTWPLTLVAWFLAANPDPQAPTAGCPLGIGVESLHQIQRPRVDVPLIFDAMVDVRGEIGR